jgi:CCR4-NOT transcriptional complex subunit CAF120
LQNVLSVSTAGRNRYLFHFNSFHSLTQWTAGIRLALFEHRSLLEAYTGSIIAGKGRELNNIRIIMERSRYKYEDWARVRFGAGTPWRRCWFVVTPPSDKDYQKLHKSSKRRSAYDRTTPILTGEIKFYDTKKIKKAKPIATITNAYSAFAIYPQSKLLIDQSTLVKIEGNITMNSQPQSSTEGFVFIMPELHPAVTGLEIMLRFLFPVFDTFGLYGRPTRLIADINNLKSLMFAFPKSRHYGYLDVLDVVNLINKSGSQGWSEKDWRAQLREATGQRMSTVNSPASSISGGRQHHWSSLPNRHTKTRFQEPSQPLSPGFNQSSDAIIETPISTTESPTVDSAQPCGHFRAISDTGALHTLSPGKTYTPTRLSVQDTPPEPPIHGVNAGTSKDRPETRQSSASGSDGDMQLNNIPRSENLVQNFHLNGPPAPVAAPPAFAHQPGEVPVTRPQTSQEMRRANNRMSSATLAQLADVSKMRVAAAGFSDIQENPYSEELESHEQMNQGSSGDLHAYPDQEKAPTVPVHADTSRNLLQQPTPQRAIQETPNLYIDTSKITKRKPVPSHAISPSAYSAGTSTRTDLEYQEDPVSALTDPSFRDLQHTVDEAALSRILPRQISFLHERTMTQISKPDDESIYDERSVSPDYASTRKSTDTKRSEISIPRPRMGVLKTVGDAPPSKQEVTIGDARYFANEELPKENPDIPSIDFGPTLIHSLHTRGPSMSDMLNNDPNSAAHRVSGGEGHARKLSRSPARDEARRSLVWQPGLANYPPEYPANHGMTPEQFVHHRSSSNSRPLDYPLGSQGARPRSGDWPLGASQLPQGRDLPPRPHSRNSTMLLNQNEMPARPHSRGSTMLLSQNDMHIRPQSRGSAVLLNQNDMSSHLSAREQEHIARMTGSTFFNFSHNKAKPAVSSGGLIGAIDAREREKQYMKEGLSNQLVQNAIAQRQQQQMYEAQQVQHPGVSGIYNMPGASYTWDNLNHNAFNQAHMVPRPATSSDWHAWNGPVASQTPPATQQPNHYFQNYQNY